jgi:hypothetical protein
LAAGPPRADEEDADGSGRIAETFMTNIGSVVTGN